MPTADLIARLDTITTYLRDTPELPTPDHVGVDSTSEFSYHIREKTVDVQCATIKALVEKYGHDGWDVYPTWVEHKTPLPGSVYIRVYLPGSPDARLSRELLAAGWRAANQSIL